MNKKEAIQLLCDKGWTKADAQRALEAVNNDLDLDEITIHHFASQFAGSELIKRQNLQRAQKALVTKKNKQIADYIFQIEKTQQQNNSSNPDLEVRIERLLKEKQELIKANDILKKDNKDLKNIVDAIKLKFTIETKHLLKLENSELKKGLVKLLKSTLG